MSLCEHRTTGARFALKRAKFGMGGQPDAQKVEIEAEALARLEHDNVIRHFTAFTHDDPAHGSVFCIMMEYADRGDLATLLSERWDAAADAKRNWLPEEDVMGWFVQLALGLAHVHSKKGATPRPQRSSRITCSSARAGSSSSVRLPERESEGERAPCADVPTPTWQRQSFTLLWDTHHKSEASRTRAPPPSRRDISYLLAHGACASVASRRRRFRHLAPLLAHGRARQDGRRLSRLPLAGDHSRVAVRLQV